MINSFVIQNCAMAVRRVRAQACINPQAKIRSELFSDLRNHVVLELMVKIFFTLVTGNGEEKEVRYAIFQIAFNLSQRGRDAETNIAAQAGDRLVGFQAFDDEKRLNQLRAVEIRLGAQVA